MVNSPWAILLCKFNDDSTEPHPRDLYEDLFTGTGSGSQNMVDFFRDMSHGKLDLSASRVFGWYTLNKSRAEYVGSGANQQGRADLLTWAKQAAAAAGVDLSAFVNVVVSMNVPTDLFGGGMGVVCDNLGLNAALLGQEMGHGYGLDHSRIEGSTQDYMDPWDVMSTQSPYSQPHPRYQSIGPGLNAANMASKDWLDKTRVYTASGRAYDTVITLRPLHRTDLQGYLAARFGDYWIEFRNRENWDARIPFPTVLIHRFEDNHSYLMPANSGTPYLIKGSVFGDADPTNPIISAFTDISRVEVLEINANERFAKIRLLHKPAYKEPSLGPGIILGGVKYGGEGILIVGGKIVKVPPHSPAINIMQALATYSSAEDISSPQLKKAVIAEALGSIKDEAAEMLESVNSFGVPNSNMRIFSDFPERPND